MNKFALKGFSITTDNNGSDQKNMFNVTFSGNLQFAIESSNPDEINQCAMELFDVLCSIEFEKNQEEEFAAMYGFFGTHEYNPECSMEDYLNQMESNPEWASQVKRFRFLENLENRTNDVMLTLINTKLKRSKNGFDALETSQQEELVCRERHALKLKFDKSCEDLLISLSN